MKNKDFCSKNFGITKQQQSKNTVEEAKALFKQKGFIVSENSMATKKYRSSFCVTNKEISLVIHVRSLNKAKNNNYTFICKKDMAIDESNYVLFVLYGEKGEDFFLIPSIVWSDPNGLFVDRNYDKPGQVSLPEWGIQISQKNMDILYNYQIHKIINVLK